MTRRAQPLAAQIVAMLEAAGFSWPGGADNAVIERTKAGRHQRAAGAWVWVLRPKLRAGKQPPFNVGGWSPATDVVKYDARPYRYRDNEVAFEVEQADIDRYNAARRK